MKMTLYELQLAKFDVRVTLPDECGSSVTDKHIARPFPSEIV